MSNLNPPKLLSVGIQVQAVTAYWAASTPQKDIDGKAKQWRLQMNVNAQLHSGVESTVPFQYDGRNIAVGDYVATGANGLLLKIDTIESANVSTVVCLASDEDRLNALMDQTQFGDGGILSGPGICFEVENQMPVLFPLPSILPAGFSRGFATQILSRFLLREKRDTLTIEQAGHGLAKKQAVVLNNTGQYEAVDYTAADATMTKRIIGVVEEPNWPTDNHFRIRTVGPIIDINSLDKNFAINLMIPKNLNDAIDTSKKYNPELIIAKLEYEQSEKDVLISRSDLSPSAKLSYENSRSQDLSSLFDERNKNILKATVTWPIYSGGKNRASLNKSRNLQNRKKLLLSSATKTNNSNVAISWSTLQSSKSLLNSVNSQVKAAEIANEGITVEYETGLGRSTLDVIQSNSILLSSKISLADSERNYLLSQFKLLQAIGLLNSNYLKIQ